MNIFEITIQRKYQDRWPVVVEHTKPGQFVPIRNQGILEINDDIAALRALTGQPEKYGAALGKALFHNDIRDAFSKALATLEDTEDGNNYVHVLLYIEADDLKELRWEKLCVLLDGKWVFLSLNQRTPFSLYIPAITEQLFPAIGRRDLQALVVAASPSGLGRFQLDSFDVDAAVAGIKTALGNQIPCDVLAKVDGAIGLPTLDALLQCLTNNEKYYTLVHLICHGKLLADGETAIYLSTDDNQVAPVNATTLIDRLSKLRRAPHFVFLSTCESASNTAEATGAMGGLAQRLVRDLGIPAVVAMTDKVSIKTAQALATTFYQKLRVHGNVDLALSEATAGLQARYDITVPALFSRLGGRPLFSDTPDRPLTPKEIKYGWEYLQKLLLERAPTLSDELNQQIAVLNRTLNTETKEALQEQQQALDAINKICSEVLDLSFPALALGKEPPAYDSRCPFRGLYPFRLEDREFFFGREQLIAQLQEKLAQDNFLPVLGASGSGKSSVVLAGLIAALQSQQPNLQMAYMTPTSDPITVLQTSLSTFLSTFQSQNFVLVIDQFEELFTLCSDEAQRQKFIDKLISFSQQQKVIITMRADFWGECATYPKLKEMMQVRQELIAPMDSAQLRRAMEMQAAIMGLRFEAGLSNSILDEVEGEPGAMPLLQHALFELWNRRQGRWLRCKQYEAIGGVKEAISKTADTVYDDLLPQEKEQVRNIFVRLTRLDEEAVQGEKRRDTRRRVELEELVSVGEEQAQIKKLVEKLAGEGARLVVTSVNSSTHREEVEVAHEALILHWKKLQNWLNENRINLQLREKIRDAALDWNQNQRQEEYLELQGGRLGYAKELSKQPYFLNKLETEYVDACVELRDRQNKQEEERQKRELKQARRIAIGSTVAAAITIVLASLAGYAWQQSKRQQVEAYAQTGKALLATNPTGGLVNAIASVGLSRSPLVNFPNYTMPNSVQSSLFSAVQTSHERNTFQGHQGIVNSVAISSDGKTIVSGGSDGTVRLWDINGQLLGEPFKADPDSVNSVAISSDGKTIVSGGYDGTVRLWRSNGQPQGQPFKGYGGSVRSVAISSDGKTIVSGGYDGTVMWRSNGQPRGKPFNTDQDIVFSVAISSDGKTIVSGGFDGTVRLWDINGQLLGEPFKADPDSVNSVAISSDGKTIVSGGDDGTVRLWRSNGQPQGQPFKGYGGSVRSVAISSDGKTIVSGGSDGTVRLWDINGQLLGEPFKGHQGDVNSVAISPDGKTIVSGGFDGTVRLWGSNGQPLGEPFKSDQGIVFSVAISSDGKTIVSGGDDGTVRLWGSNGQPLGEPFKGHPGRVLSVAISSDGKTIVSHGDDGTVRLWGSNGQPLGEPFTGDFFSVAISSDGKTIVSGGNDGTVRLWGSNGQPRGKPFKAHQGDVNSVAISSDGKTIVSGGDDGTVRLWGSNGQPLGQPFTGHQSDVFSVAISSDGKTIVSGGSDGTVRLWDINGQLLGEPFKADPDSVNSVAISSDGKTIVSGGNDGTVRLWGSNGQPLGEPFKSDQGDVRSVAISSDGKTIVSGGKNGTVRLWDMNLEHWMKSACEQLRYHVILTKPKDAVAKEAKATCEQYWHLQP